MYDAFHNNPPHGLHHLVAEAIEVQGGLRKLTKLLNRLGSCVAVDTHDRLVTAVAEGKKPKEFGRLHS